MKRKFWKFIAGGIIAFSLLFFIYPAATLTILLTDSELRNTGQSHLVPMWFASAAGRFDSWAKEFLESEYAAGLHHNDVAPTEWPIFGSVFLLVTAEDLYKQGKIDIRDAKIQKAIERAIQIVVSPTTATWVKTKWGDQYLETENVFYRMLVIMGISSYENLTGKQKHRKFMSEQRISLAKELSNAKLHLLDDYPGECYPNDILWAVAAIQRAAKLEGTDHDELIKSLMASFDGPVKAPEGLPAFEVDSKEGHLLQKARGCGNSGILHFAAELDPTIAQTWYAAYEKSFWKENEWAVGFTEMPHGTFDDFMDVDSGPVVYEFGSVASVLGIGAAKCVGRLDHAVPLTLEGISVSWPTPFGFLAPGILGKLSVDSWCLGEIAMLFTMTRPNYVDTSIPFTGPTPKLVWASLAFYTSIGLLLIFVAIFGYRRIIR